MARTKEELEDIILDLMGGHELSETESNKKIIIPLVNTPESCLR